MFILIIKAFFYFLAVCSAQRLDRRTCQNSVQLYSEKVIKDDLDFVVFGNLVNETRKGSTCVLSNKPDKLFSFSINLPDTHTMVFDIRMTDENDGDSIDTILALSTDCSSFLFCNDDYDGITSRITGNLENGDYFLIASFYENIDNNSTFKLTISFRKTLKPTRPPPLGSCKNPTESFEIPRTELVNFYQYVYLDQSMYIDSVKPVCSQYNSSDYIVKIIVPKNLEIFLEIRSSSFDNKFDTLIAITDSDCNPLNDTMFCNDDSPIHSGLGSYVNGYLTSGEYKLVFSAYNSDYSGSFFVLVNSTIIKNGPYGDYGTCFNPVNLYTEQVIPKEGLNDHVIFGNLTNFNSSDQMVSCVYVPYWVPKVVYRFDIPDKIEMYYDIQMTKSDGSNKMDTVLELLNEKCEFIDYFYFYSYCNDDSNPPGGVSSRLNGNLTSGTYKLIATVNNYDNIGSYKIKASFKPKN